MKSWIVLFLLTACASSTPNPAPSPDAAPAPSERDEHRWLQRFVGDWEVRSSAVMAEGAEPVVWESTERGRAVGGLWVMVENTMGEGSQRFTSVMTLGYDSREEAFVGTWIDSMQTKLWIYDGRLDDERRVLSLEAEGPALGDPTRTARYRDVIEWVDDDHRRMTSSVQRKDGEWSHFMTVEAHRVR